MLSHTTKGTLKKQTNKYANVKQTHKHTCIHTHKYVTNDMAFHYESTHFTLLIFNYDRNW